MIEFIAHRINTTEEIKQLPPQFGLELDLRDSLDGRIYMQHDPFVNGEDFEGLLRFYQHGTMILNIKSERIEPRVLALLKTYSITNFFFLDSSFPMIKTLSDKGESRLALRYSEFEGVDTLRNMQGKVQWVWVDCFNNFPLSSETAKTIKELGYKICVVSPELQGQPEKIEKYAENIRLQQLPINAICTKVYNIERWRDLLGV